MKENHSFTPEPFIGKSQVSQMLGFHRRSIERYMARGLPYYRIDRAARFKASEVAKWMEENHKVVRA